MQIDKNNPQNQKEQVKGCLIFLFIIGVITSFLVNKCSCGNDDIVAEKRIYDKVDALVQSRPYVEENLKSPSTAEFGDETEGVTQINDTTFNVISTVDSQNSFGAMLRSNYSCKIIFHPKDTTYNVENFHFFE